MKEEWRKIEGFPYYEISNYGVVRSLDKVVNGGGGAIYTKKGRILKRRLNKCGYLRVGMMIGWHKVKWISVHRLVASAFIPNPENKRTVNHIDGNKQNNSVNNLEWNTQQENVDHAVANGIKMQAKGIQFRTRTSFDEMQIVVIKSLKGRFSNSQMASYFGVHRITISNILTGKTWKHISLRS